MRTSTIDANAQVPNDGFSETVAPIFTRDTVGLYIGLLVHRSSVRLSKLLLEFLVYICCLIGVIFLKNHIKTISFRANNLRNQVVRRSD